MEITRSLLLLGGLAVVATLSACRRDEVEPPPARAVKLETVGARASNGTRFVATVRQEQRAELAFENGGRIADIAVDVGEVVRQGRVLARLDSEPIHLRLQQAEAGVVSATAQVGERQTQLRQQQAMYNDGSASLLTLTSAKTALVAAQAQLRGARANLDMAVRAQRTSELRAPFDGAVVARLMQPHADAAPGQAVLQIVGRGHLQAVALLPQDRAGTLEPGATVQAWHSGNSLMLRVRGVSSQMEGAAVQAIFDFVSSSVQVRSGDILLMALPGSDARPLSVPLSGVLPTGDGDAAWVFVYQTATGTVRRREVHLGELQGERVQIRSGLKTGEQVVAAGASFLGDGQKVIPYRSASHLADGDNS